MAERDAQQLNNSAIQEMMGTMGASIAQSFVKTLLQLLNSGQYSQSLGSALVRAAGIDPGSGVGQFATGVVGNVIRTTVSAGVNAATGTSDAYLRASDILNHQSTTDALKSRYRETVIDKSIEMQRVFKTDEEYNTKDSWVRRDKIDKQFDAKKMAENFVKKKYLQWAGEGATEEDANNFLKSGLGKTMIADEYKHISAAQVGVINAFHDRHQRNRLDYDENRAVPNIAAQSGKLLNLMAQSRSEGNFGDLTTADVTAIARRSIDAASNNDLKTDSGLGRIAQTIERTAQAVDNIKDLTGKNTPADVAMAILDGISGNATVGESRSIELISKSIRDTLQTNNIDIKTYGDMVKRSSGDFQALGLNVSSAQAASLTLQRLDTFGDGKNRTTGGVSDLELQDAQNKQLADTMASGADHTVAAAWRAYAEKNGLNTRDKEEFKKFMAKTGGYTSVAELAKALDVDANRISELTGDSETRKLVMTQGITGAVTRQRMQTLGNAVATFETSKEESKLIAEAGIDLGKQTVEEQKQSALYKYGTKVKKADGSYEYRENEKVNNYYKLIDTMNERLAAEGNFESVEAKDAVLTNLADPRKAPKQASMKTKSEPGRAAQMRDNGTAGDVIQTFITGVSSQFNGVTATGDKLNTNLSTLNGILSKDIIKMLTDIVNIPSSRSTANKSNTNSKK